MKTTRIIPFFLWLAASFEASAALYDRGHGLIYDDELDVTWMQEPSSVPMDWETAKDWAKNLKHAGYSDWRLPTAINTDGTGPCMDLFECEGDEFGYLFYRSLANYSAPSKELHEINTGPFENVGLYFYWTETEMDKDNAWFFYFLRGSQYYHAKDNEILAWAVRDGDSSPRGDDGVITTPIPSGLLLTILPLVLLLFMGKRDQNRNLDQNLTFA